MFDSKKSTDDRMLLKRMSIQMLQYLFVPYYMYIIYMYKLYTATVQREFIASLNFENFGHLGCTSKN